MDRGEWGAASGSSSKEDLWYGAVAVAGIGVVAFFVRVEDAGQILRRYAIQALMVVAVLLGAALAAWLILILVRGLSRSAHEQDADEDDEEEEEGEGEDEGYGGEEAEDESEGGQEPSLLDAATAVPFLLKVISNRRGCHLEEIAQQLREAGEWRWTKRSVKAHLETLGIPVFEQTNLGPPWGNKIGVKKKYLPAPGATGQQPGFTIEDTPNGGRVNHHP